ncbi:hypothetical protein [Ligilactobacillus aviarius]|uniref:hypothetical protein n=1 Tax=Ligilactobacillus aviarius TaxID=1606 RepID=UPI0024BB752E|nr:hypothetical protein [Ligilactobacillus aviarius]
MLSYDTYTQLGFKALTQEQFKKQVAIAQTLVENITNQFYADGSEHTIEQDLQSTDSFIKRRALIYEKAICMQCDFAQEYGATPAEQTTGAINSVHIGNASINYNKGATVDDVTYGNSGVSMLVFNILYPTGLLYSGVAVVDLPL